MVYKYKLVLLVKLSQINVYILFLLCVLNTNQVTMQKVTNNSLGKTFIDLKPSNSSI